MTDFPTDRLLTMFYAAVEVIADQRAAEIEMEHDTVDPDGTQQRWAITVRHQVRDLLATTEDYADE